ncbi:MAG TPA: TolC family protein, partial [Sandaracinaceae bacterium]
LFFAAASAQAQPAEGGAPQGAATVDLEAVMRGEGHGLTADSAAERAMRTAPSVDRARAGVRLAGAGADRVLYNFIPQLAVSFRYTRLSEIQQASLFEGPSIDPDTIPALVAGVDDPDARFLWEQTLRSQAELANFRFPVLLDNYAFRAELLYPLSDVFLSILPAYEAAQENVQASRHQVSAQLEEVAYNAREAFYNYARARGGLAVAQMALEQAQARHRQVQAFVAAGTAAPVDEMRLRAQVATASVALVRARGQVQVAATALRTLLHFDEDAEIAVAEDVLGPLPELPASPEALVERALRDREDVAALRALIRAANHQISAAEGSRYPRIALQAGLDVANPNQRVFPQTAEFRESWDVSAVVRWSPHDLLNGEAQASEARARRDQAEADLRALEDGIRVQVIEAATTYRAARESLEAARIGVQAAEENYRVQMERFRAGASTLTEVTDAQAELVRAQLDLINGAIDARVAWARLARALGTGAPAELR